MTSEKNAEKNYAVFWKCALQVNSWTYNAEYQGGSHGLTEEAYNKELGQRLVNNQIKVVGIADHGSVENLDGIRATLQELGIIVFPGFEIASTEKVHMVCLYPEGTDSASLNQYLGGLQIDQTNPTAPSSLSCLELAKKIDKQGGFWFAAHASSTSGILRLNQDGGGLHHIWKDSDLVLAAQIPGDIDSLPNHEMRKIVRNKNPQYKRKRLVALLNAKDVRKPDDVESERCYSWVKMTEPDLSALKLACRDPESRVRLSHEINPAYYSRINRITVRRGYLDGLHVALSPNLNAIVGGRGTGKSTMIEALRFVLDHSPANADTKRAHESIIKENFAKEKAGIEISITSFQQNSESYIVSRYHGEQAKVLDNSGNVLQLTPRDVLPKAEIYGQNELLAIAQDPGAKARLLGRFLPDDGPVRASLAEVSTQLESNRSEISKLEADVVKISSRLEELPALLDKEKSFNKLGLSEQLDQVKNREVERNLASDAEKALLSLQTALETFQETLDAIELPQIPSETPLPNSAKLAELVDTVSNVRQKFTESTEILGVALESTSPKLAASKAELDHQISIGEQKFNTEIDKLPSMKGKSVPQLAADYKIVTSKIAELQPLGAKKTAIETKLVALNQVRQTLLEDLDKQRGIRWTELTKAVKKLNKRLTGQLRIDFEPARIRQPLVEFFLACSLDGVGQKRLSWIEEAESLSVSGLVATLRLGADALVEEFKEAGISKQAANAIANLPSEVIRELEELELPESLDLLLNISKDAENYREIGRLSTGQQCTAILHLLLLDNPDPLIIDQPEDNLDNAFIAEHIVSELRKSKTRRQFLFATHNANIPVFGDAEWIGVLMEKDGKSVLEASGSIDASDVKELSASILEGGKDAFNRRREKYGL